MSKDIFKVQMLLAFKKWKRLQTEGSVQHSEASKKKKGMLKLFTIVIWTLISTTWLRAEVMYKQE